MAGQTFPPYMHRFMDGRDETPRSPMRIRPFLMGLAFGVIITTIVGMFALYGNDLKWQRLAVDHGAAVYYRENVKQEKLEWIWIDDWFRTKVMPKAKEAVHATPSPNDKWQPL
jgi:hypothetical protein